ncbi:MAG: CPCC family cysteine-rich protein [Acidobacteriota bacterium]
MPKSRFACPCCGFLTLVEEPPGTYALCPVCFWEDDAVQFRNPEYEGGANKVSLAQARRNYARFGASEPQFLIHVRPPLPEEASSSSRGAKPKDHPRRC